MPSGQVRATKSVPPRFGHHLHPTLLQEFLHLAAGAEDDEALGLFQGLVRQRGLDGQERAAFRLGVERLARG